MSKKKKKRQNAGRRRRRMRRPARLADARQWLATPQETNVLRAYERRYSVDRLCAIKELRSLGVAISEEYEAQVRDSFERRAKARAAKRAAKQRAAMIPASRVEPYEDAALIEESWNGDDDGYSIDRSWNWDDASTARERSWNWDDDDASIDRCEPSFDAVWDPLADVAPDRFGGYGARSIEDTLLEDVRALDLRVIETKVESLDDGIVHVRMVLEDDPAVLARCAWGLIFAIGASSFADAGAEIDFADHDEWTAADMLRCLSFDRGRLCFRADHVRGRCMETMIEIDREGRITLETAARDEAAMRWVSNLQGKAAMPGFGHDDDTISMEPLPF